MSVEFIYEEGCLQAEEEIISEVREILRARVKAEAIKSDARDAKNRLVVKKEHVPDLSKIGSHLFDVICL